MEQPNQEQDQVKITREYYDSSDADEFYFHIWGGEDIHIGIYEQPDVSIKEASRLTVEKMIDQLDIQASTKVLDIGSGYGGSARVLAHRFRCQVDCLNLSEKENQRNIQKNKESGLASSINLITGNFESLPFEDNH